MAQTEYTSQAHGSLVLSALPRRGGTEALVRAAAGLEHVLAARP